MKIQVFISDELVSKVDSYAKKMGVSRSSLCAIFIGQSIMAYDKSYGIIDDLSNTLSNHFLEKENENLLSIKGDVLEDEG